jgi:hypothetical protein
MGIKERNFSPLPCDVSLEELVPIDSFYRRLEAALDLSFVRDLVRSLYAGGGRPSVDPVVFFKLQLVLFFEGLRKVEGTLLSCSCMNVPLGFVERSVGSTTATTTAVDTNTWRS